MSVGNRIKKIIELCFESQNDLCKQSGLDKITISRYIHNQVTPSSDGLIKLLDAGISSDWILSGIGGMFAENIAGLRLKEKYIEENNFEYNSPIGRIKYWIDDNYYSVKHFCIALDYDYKKILRIFEDNHILDPDFLQVLQRSGCNLDWILDEMGEPYTTCPVGSFLKLQSGKRNKLVSEDLAFENLDQGPFFNEKQLNQLNTLPRIMTVLKGVEYEKKIT